MGSDSDNHLPEELADKQLRKRAEELSEDFVFWDGSSARTEIWKNLWQLCMTARSCSEKLASKTLSDMQVTAG